MALLSALEASDVHGRKGDGGLESLLGDRRFLGGESTAGGDDVVAISKDVLHRELVRQLSSLSAALNIAAAVLVESSPGGVEHRADGTPADLWVVWIQLAESQGAISLGKPRLVHVRDSVNRRSGAGLLDRHLQLHLFQSVATLSDAQDECQYRRQRRDVVVTIHAARRATRSSLQFCRDFLQQGCGDVERRRIDEASCRSRILRGIVTLKENRLRSTG